MNETCRFLPRKLNDLQYLVLMNCYLHVYYTDLLKHIRVINDVCVSGYWYYAELFRMELHFP